jgi:putative membrane protein
MAEPLVAYLHFLAIVLLFGFLVGELVVCRPGMSADQVRRLPGLDIAFFMAALLALATGLLRLFFFGKGLGFYLPNPVFWAKMALYAAVALISIRPTLTFIRWRRTVASAGPPPDAEVARVRRLLHLELGLAALIPLAAVLMARGIGR